MKLEQPAALNRYVDPSIPLTWRWRWRTLRILAPLLLLAVFCLFESVTIKVWTNGEALADAVVRAVLGTTFLIAFLSFIIEITIRMTHRAKRVLQLDHKHVTFSHYTKQWRIPWAQIKAFQMEPIPDQAQLAKVHCVGLLTKRATLPRKWSLVLDRTKQLPMLINELRSKHQLAPSFAVDEFAEPLPPAGSRSSSRIWPMILGVYLLIHGLPLLAAACVSRQSERTPKSERKLSKSAERVFLRHFRSANEFRRFLFFTGGVLTASGVTFYGWGIKTTNACRRENEAAMARDQAAEALLPRTVILPANQ